MKRIAHLIVCVAAMLSNTFPALAGEGLPPNAVDDHVDADGNTMHIYVLANDTAPGGSLDSSTLSIVSAPSQGEAVVIAVGAPRIKYTAIGTQGGIDSFQYAICDSEGLCATAMVTVNLSAIATTTTTLPSTTTQPPLPPPPRRVGFRVNPCDYGPYAFYPPGDRCTR